VGLGTVTSIGQPMACAISHIILQRACTSGYSSPRKPTKTSAFRLIGAMPLSTKSAFNSASEWVSKYL
jgi:hypothetical protein